MSKCPTYHITDFGLPEGIANAYINKGIHKLYDWQGECLSIDGVLNGRNLVYSAPTSGGKTLVAEILVLKNVNESSKRALFVLPYVSIVSEKANSFREICHGSGLTVLAFHSGSTARATAMVNYNIAVCTIEKANLLVNGLLEFDVNFDTLLSGDEMISGGGSDNSRGVNRFAETIGCVVIDELHLMDDAHRGYLLELLITKILFFAPQCQIIAMSATIPNLVDISDWLRGAALYQTNFRPVDLHEYIYFDRKVMNLSNLDALKGIWVESKLSGEICRIHQPSNSISHIEQDLMSLVRSCTERKRQVLVFCATRSRCESTASGTLLEACKHNDFFSNFDFQNCAYLENATSELKLCHASQELINCIQHGVAWHHSGLTTDEREIVENLYRKGVVMCLACTSTLAAGVNLPAQRVIFREPYIAKDLLDVTRYKQMAGRAGRTGLSDSNAGQSIVMCTNEKEALLMREVAHKDLPPVRSALTEDKNGLQRLILEVVSTCKRVSSESFIELIECTFLKYYLRSIEKSVNISSQRTVCRSLSSDPATSETEEFPIEKSPTFSAIKSAVTVLLASRLLRFDSAINYYVCTAKGHGVSSSGLDIEDGCSLYDTFSPIVGSTRTNKAPNDFNGLSLNSDFHVCFLCVDPSSVIPLRNIDWRLLVDTLEFRLGTAEKTVIRKIGIDMQLIHQATMTGTFSSSKRLRKSRGNDHPDNLSGNKCFNQIKGGSSTIQSDGETHEYQIKAIVRLYTALMIWAQLHGVSPDRVARRYSPHLSRGAVQGILKSSSAYTAAALQMCTKLGWSLLHSIIDSYFVRLSASVYVKPELAALSVIPGLSGVSMQNLYNSGLTSPTLLASSGINTVSKILGIKASAAKFLVDRAEEIAKDQRMKRKNEVVSVLFTQPHGVNEKHGSTKQRNMVVHAKENLISGSDIISDIENITIINKTDPYFALNQRNGSPTLYKDQNPYNSEFSTHQGKPDSKYSSDHSTPDDPISPSKSGSKLQSPISKCHHDRRVSIDRMSGICLLGRGSSPINSQFAAEEETPINVNLARSSKRKTVLAASQKHKKIRRGVPGFVNIPISTEVSHRRESVRGVRRSVSSSEPLNTYPSDLSSEELSDVIKRLKLLFDSNVDKNDIISNMLEVDLDSSTKPSSMFPAPNCSIFVAFFENERTNMQSSNDAFSIDDYVIIMWFSSSWCFSILRKLCTLKTIFDSSQTHKWIILISSSPKRVIKSMGIFHCPVGLDMSVSPDNTSESVDQTKSNIRWTLIDPQNLRWLADSCHVKTGHGSMRMSTRLHEIISHEERKSFIRVNLSIVRDELLDTLEYINRCSDDLLILEIEIESDFRIMLAEMETIGVSVNIGYWLETTGNLVKLRMSELTHIMFCVCGRTVNLENNEDVSIALFNDLGIPVNEKVEPIKVKKNGTKIYSTKQSVLQECETFLKGLKRSPSIRDSSDVFVSSAYIKSEKSANVNNSVDLSCIHGVEGLEHLQSIPGIVMEYRKLSGVMSHAMGLDYTIRSDSSLSSSLLLPELSMSSQQWNYPSSQLGDVHSLKENTEENITRSRDFGKTIVHPLIHGNATVTGRICMSDPSFICFESTFSVKSPYIESVGDHFNENSSSTQHTDEIILPLVLCRCDSSSVILRPGKLLRIQPANKQTGVTPFCLIDFGDAHIVELSSEMVYRPISRNRKDSGVPSLTSNYSFRVGIRDVVVAREGCVLVSIDYSQLEFRILAHFCEDPGLLEIFKDSSKHGDIFVQIAAKWLRKNADDITNEERSGTKKIIYGILYGMGIETLSKLMNMSLQETDKMVNEFYTEFPGIKIWIEKFILGVRKSGNVVYSLLRRRRQISNMADNSGRRQAINTVCQSTAVDLMKVAMLKVRRVIRETGLEAWVLLQIHDELLIEVRRNPIQQLKFTEDPIYRQPEDMCNMKSNSSLLTPHIREFIRVVTECMTNAVKLRVALETKWSIGRSWGDIK